MRRTLILTLAVLACAVALCALSRAAVNRTVAEALRLRSLTVQAAEAERKDRAQALMAELARYWEDRAPLMELLASHDALHDAGAAIAEARICLDCDDHDDFLRTMSTLEMGLTHLSDEEAIRWENLY